MYCKVIVDISHRQVDRTFEYHIPEELESQAHAGVTVEIPFGKGNNLRKGFILEVTDHSEFPPEKIKDLVSISEKAVTMEEEMISLAIWMRHRYGGTLYQCLQVVMPVKTKVNALQKKFYHWIGSEEELNQELETCIKKKFYARKRLLEALKNQDFIPASFALERLNITVATAKPLVTRNLLEIVAEEKSILAEGQKRMMKQDVRGPITLNDNQLRAVDGIMNDKRQVCLLHGVTGSGKTEVYIELIARTIAKGQEVIVLIPEISLTYQAVMRYYKRFGEQVSIVNSRVSAGEKWERFDRASKGQIKVMIGPRSALFTPFQNLGLIIIDEEQDSAYFSEQVPKYHALETAVERVKLHGGKVVLGSATPSVVTYYHSVQGEYGRYELPNRAVENSHLPEVEVVDLREELKSGNRSIFSKSLQRKIQARLERKEQTILFLNRRGYSGFVSCRMCGQVMECPHCSVSMTYHKNGSLVCHYCGYTKPMVKECPKCHSPYIGTFGTGTQRVETAVMKMFPEARILRMDADTTASKDGHQEILQKFDQGEADILIGTQMIVKGHDFPKVTLVGILAADLSLNVADYRSSEQTFQLLTQAEGRAGRGDLPGECVVQTYHPEHYSICAAAKQDYDYFYQKEMEFRKQMKYPPAGYFMNMILSGKNEDILECAMNSMAEYGKRELVKYGTFIGPTDMNVEKVRDMHRKIIYFKSPTLENLLCMKQRFERLFETEYGNEKLYVSFE